MKDRYGREVMEGDVVVYGMRQGNSGALGVGVITSVEAKSATVRGVTGPDFWNKTPKINTRTGRLTERERLLVITFESLPTNIVGLLRSI